MKQNDIMKGHIPCNGPMQDQNVFSKMPGSFFIDRRANRAGLLNIAFGFLCMEKCSISAERSLVSSNMTCSPSLVSLTMTCGPSLKSSNIFISDAR